ncbi:MAG TPA: hypothetical protein VIX59_09540 [Candidatus Binataceae bacterium]
MELEAGVRIRVAPRFHARLAWQDRILLNSGVSASGPAFFPRHDWRPASALEAAMLIDASVSGQSTEALTLLGIPAHLRAKWWSLAGQQEDSPSGAEFHGLDEFARELAAYASFKRWQLPSDCKLQVIASRPGQSSTRVDTASSELQGLDFNCAPFATPGAQEAANSPRAIAGFNLGDEATSLVWLNLSTAQVRERVGYSGPRNDSDAADSGTALAHRFFAALADYPLVRIVLEPGEGYLLPEGGAVCDGYTVGKREVDVMLLLIPAPTRRSG